MDYIPFTRNCIITTFKGVPVGAQMAWLSCSNTGTPIELTRVAAITQVAVVQNGAGMEACGHPAMAYIQVCVTMGCPPTLTRGLGTVG
jgi:hypothetical protein